MPVAGLKLVKQNEMTKYGEDGKTERKEFRITKAESVTTDLISDECWWWKRKRSKQQNKSSLEGENSQHKRESLIKYKNKHKEKRIEKKEEIHRQTFYIFLCSYNSNLMQ